MFDPRSSHSERKPGDQTTQFQNKRSNLIPSADLAEVMDAWPTLPEPIKAGILAMIRSASATR